MRSVVPGRQHDEDLADEAAQARQAHRGEEDDGGDAAVERHRVEQAAELVEVASVDPVVNHADQEEHAGRADAVGDHLEHRAVHAIGVDIAGCRAGGSSTAMPRIT